MREPSEEEERLERKNLRFSLSDQRRRPDKRLKDWRRRDMRVPRERRKIGWRERR